MGIKKNIIQFAKRCWHSPTLNTWLSYSTKALSLFVVLPLILHKFNTQEIALWYLFATVISLQGLADMGFKLTYIRLISYAHGGAEDIHDYSKVELSTYKIASNWDLIGRIYSIMNYTYTRLTFGVFAILLILGSWALNKSISVVPEQNQAWIAWAVIVLVSCIKFYGTIYSNYLEGLNQIALVRRLEALTSVGSILSGVLVLIFFKSLLWLVVSNQIWIIIVVFRDKYLCHTVENGKFLDLKLRHPFDKVLFHKIWEPAWKSGISGFMSNGLSNITSILYAQIGNSASVAAYLIALRIINQIRDISAAPFYSKIPLFAKLRAQGKIDELIQKAQRGMFMSNMIFIIGALGFGFVANFLLLKIGSDIKFIDQKLWLLLTFAYLIHRYGAMHIHLYSTSNHIISHIADGVSGIIFIAVTFLFIKTLDLYAIPVGMLAGYLGFYSWYAGMHSYRFMKTSFLKFEMKASGLPVLILIVYFLVYLLKQRI
jgi:O-antigen/teichoic acid export membrane protein